MKKDNCSGDYINRQMAITHVYVVLSPHIDSAIKAEKALRQLPTIDAVEVVRCKDCKWNNGKNYCLNDGTFFELCADDAYCSFGERKNDEQT